MTNHDTVAIIFYEMNHIFVQAVVFFPITVIISGRLPVRYKPGTAGVSSFDSVSQIANKH